MFIYTKFLQPEAVPLLEKTLQPAPFIRDPLAETSGNVRKPLTNGVKDNADFRGRRRGTPDSLDDILGPALGDDEDDFISDDDGAGYLDEVNGHGKRGNAHLDAIDGFDGKRRATYQAFQPTIHHSFQPGSTPWRGNRKYLCQYKSRLEDIRLIIRAGLNLTGFVWTVDQDTHHTVTVEFYDQEFHRGFHFTDPYLYDKACLSILVSRNPTDRMLITPRREWHLIFLPSSKR